MVKLYWNLSSEIQISSFFSSNAVSAAENHGSARLLFTVGGDMIKTWLNWDVITSFTKV
ncbi:hypothetical protein BVRB_1g007240 [Beta vulgaris subsp. vulgaris]|nr:hypothetical protein BVRB_1g007240 [Beta vulgaris subsp. vulgaris]